MSKFAKFMNSHWAILSLIVYIINISLILYFNPFNVVGDYTQTVIFSMVLVGFFNLLLWMYFKNKRPDSLHTLSFLFKALTIIFSIFFVFGLIFAIGYFILFTPWPLTILVTILNICIVIGLLAIAYKYLNKGSTGSQKSKTGLVLQLIKQLIFYIPCLLIDLVEYIKHQYKITTKTVWILLLIEIAIIMLRFIVPYIYKLVHHRDGKLVETGPIYLNNEKDLGIFQNYKSGNTDNGAKNTSPFNYNFGVSCWMWINPQPESTSPAYTRPTSLLNYGDVLKINFNKNKIEILAATTQDSVTEPNKLVNVYESSDLLYQKWNNYVINYFGGTLDIFINGKLVVSQINITPILFPTKVTSGATNGINGGIKNVVYYDKALSKFHVNSIYNSG